MATKDKAKQQATYQRFYERHAQQIREKNLAYYYAHREAILAKRKVYYQAQKLRRAQINHSDRPAEDGTTVSAE